MKSNKKKGFTLIELLAVIAILAILLIIAIPSVIKMYNNAKDNTFKTETQSVISTATKQFMTEQLESNNANLYYCYDGTDNSKPLDMSGSDKLHYILKGDKSKITEVLVCDGTRCSYAHDEEKGIDTGSIETVAKEGEEGYSNQYDSLCTEYNGTSIFDLTYKGVRKVKVVVNTGSSSPEEVTVDYGESKEFTITAGEGNNIEGAELENCGEAILNENKLTISNITTKITCKVNLVKDEYTISYNANGGSGAPESQTKLHGEELTLDSTEPTREGFDFLGWATTENAEEAEYEKGSTFTTNANTTLYAVWEEIKYNVAINVVGGTSEPSSLAIGYFGNSGAFTITAGSGYSLTNATVSCSNSQSATLNSGKLVFGSVTKDTVCTVNLDPNKYTITYDVNGGTGSVNPQTKTHDTKLTITTTRPTRIGYDFLGWSTSSTASTATYQPGADYILEGNKTLYAVWALGPTLTLGNGSVSINPAGITKYLTFTPTVSGYYTIAATSAGDSYVHLYNSSGIQIAYNDDSDGTKFKLSYDLVAGTTYSYGIRYFNTSITGTINYTFSLQYAISYNMNGGSGSISTQYKTPGTNLTLSSTVPTRTGYDFLGWSESSSATEATYAKGGTFSKDANATLYAVWKLKEYTITYDANGGTGGPNNQTKTYGTNITLSNTTPTRSGYDFLGWSTSNTATSATYQASGTFSTNANTTLYAVWQLATYTVTYNNNSGSGCTSKSVTYNSTYGTLCTPTMDGYEFVGWYKESGLTNQVTSTTTVTQTADHTLYAKWKQLPPFATDSWKTIQKAVQSGSYPYQVGDTKTITLAAHTNDCSSATGSGATYACVSSNEPAKEVTIRVSNTSACTNGETSETACGFVVEFVDIIEKHNMNSENETNTVGTNLGGWRDSEMRTYVNGTLFNALPGDLQEVISDTTVVSGHGKTSGESNFTTTDKLYLLSTKEVWNGGTEKDTADSDSITRQLDYYAQNNVTLSNCSLAKKQYNGSNMYWWLRSANSGDPWAFLDVTNGGGRNISHPSFTYGLSAAFRIGE